MTSACFTLVAPMLRAFDVGAAAIASPRKLLLSKP
jgi:hypothetical protein